MTVLKNPGLTGTFTFDTLIYASSGLNYSAVPALSQYQIYDSPDPSYVTGRIDISAFAQLGASVPWPFQPTNVPLNGHVCIPHGRGPFPLAVFAHGNHSPLENSTPGYLYLCQLFASHGIIAATIDVNFLNGFNFGENDARAIVHLEHLKQFRIWNGTHHHPLHRKINLHRFLIIGHSRGGEGVGHASLFNTLTSVQPDVMSPVVPLDGSAGLGPFGFALKAVAAIAPTDRQYEPIAGPTVVPDKYFLIHGSRDGDVSTFEGYNTYNRAHAVNLANPTVSDGKFKALLWVFGANHNQFNSVWPSETPPATTMPRPDQERVAKIQLGALAQLLLLRRKRYLRVLRDHAVAAPWMPVGTDFVSQYQDPQREFLVHNQEGLGPPQISAPVQGTVNAVQVTADRQQKDLVNAGAPQSTITLRVEWNAPGARLTFGINPASLPVQPFRTLAFRIGQSTEALNAVGQDQDLTIEISSGSRTAAIPASSLHRLLYPDVVFGAGKIVMQSLRLSVRRLADLGIDPRDLRSIAFAFDRTATGVVYVGDVQLSNLVIVMREGGPMPSTPPRAVAVEASASQPTDADNAAITRLSQATGRDLPPVAYLVKIQLETVPEATSSGWALYVGNFRIPKYWEYKDGIYFKVYDPQFFTDHAGGALRFSPDGTEFIETGLVLTSPEILPSAATETPDLPQQRDILG